LAFNRLVQIEEAVQARGLTKVYGDVPAVRGIDFDVHAGECFGFLGPNGAGKSTTMRMIYGFTPITSGELCVLGMRFDKDARRIKARLGVVPQEENLDEDLNVLKNLLVYARYFDMPSRLARERAQQELEFWQLWERRQSRIRELSGGMKRRLLIGRAMLNNPSLLILDEPTTGLDPQARHLVWQKLRQLRSQGTTMILTTHYMDEAAQLCDRLVFMNEGRILAGGAPADLIKEHIPSQVLEIRGGESDLQRLKAQLEGSDALVEEVGDSLYIYSDDADSLRQGIDLSCCREVMYRLSSLEDVFLRLTGRALVE
jgi:lipooligosaccharide transport system ATP-binding protein